MILAHNSTVNRILSYSGGVHVLGWLGLLSVCTALEFSCCSCEVVWAPYKDASWSATIRAVSGILGQIKNSLKRLY